MATPDAAAQSAAKIFFNTPGSNVEPIDIEGQIGIDSSGNLVVNCKDINLRCGMNVNNNYRKPSINLDRQPAGNITTGQYATLTWMTTNSTVADVCITSAVRDNVATSQVSGWNGNHISQLGGSKMLSFTQSGEYVLSLVCYNQVGVSNVASNTVRVTGNTVPPPPPPPPPPFTVPACDFSKLAIASNSEAAKKVQPSGFTGIMKSWQDLMITTTEYPHVSGSGARPVGSFTLRTGTSRPSDPPMIAKFISTQFVAPPNLFKVLTWETMQVQPGVGYNISARHADSIFVSISPCSGDLRPYDINSVDPWIKKCRFSGPGASMSYGTGNGASLCKLEPGNVYYMNFAIVDTVETPISTSNTTCARVGPSATSGGRCEAQFTH